MAKVVITKLENSTARQIGAKAAGTREKNIAAGRGKAETLTTLNANSGTFGDDLTYAFGKNVAKARRENKRLTGSSDFVPAKR